MNEKISPSDDIMSIGLGPHGPFVIVAEFMHMGRANITLNFSRTKAISFNHFRMQISHRHKEYDFKAGELFCFHA